MLTPTPEQSAILGTHLDTKDNLIINAYAGCGKTTTIELICKQTPRATSTLVLAFNVRIKEELATRLAKFQHIQVLTMNSLGHTAIRNGLRIQITLDNNKPYRLLRQILLQNNIAMPKEDHTLVISSYRQAMIAGLVPSDFPNETIVPDLPEIWTSFEPDGGPNVAYAARLLLIASIQEGLQGIITYDDQIYLSTLFCGRFPRFACVIVDEAQDLSPMNHKMIEKCAVSRIIGVGDEKQSCYAFRGADRNSMRNLQTVRSNWLKLPLATTFRCPKVIVSRNAFHATGFRAAEANVEGLVETYRDEWAISPQNPLAILCRNNAPLISLAFKLLRRNIGVTFIGRDIGKSLITLFNRICPDPFSTSDEIVIAINDWKDLELAKAINDHEKINSIHDRAECLLTILDANCKTGLDFTKKLTKLFSSENSYIILSTIHRAKGLEWENVMHLDPWRLDPDRLSRKFDEGDLSAEDLQQELNLRYILETRTKRKLMEGSVKSFSGIVF